MPAEMKGKTLGKYEIIDRISEGGMAAVFKAYQPGLDRYVAIKVIRPRFAQDPVFVKRFEREAKSIARLKHPHILPVHDVGVDQGYSYIVMQYVESEQTLSRVMSQSLPQERAIKLISQVGSALAHAHNQGVIHRDVKPSNVLIDDGWPLLADFGLVKVSEASTNLTEAGSLLGTVRYMSPEQLEGQVVDHRTDIYALGVILYEMLTGTIPHEAHTRWAIIKKRTTEPPSAPRSLNPDIPESVEKVILRALEIDPEDRYDSAQEFVDALQQASTDNESTVVLSAGKKSLRDTLRNPIVVAALVIIIGIGGVLGWNISNSDSSELDTNQTAPIAAKAPTSTNTATLFPTGTPISTPPPAAAWTPTHTPTSSPTWTPTYTSQPTPSPIVVTATPSPTPVVPPASTPKAPTANPTITSIPTPSAPTGTFSLLKPHSVDEPTYGPTDFEWEWAGDLPLERGFEVRVWREGEPQAGVHDAVLDNKTGRIERIGENKYRLNVDISQAAGVQGRHGEYLWTVVLVQISPEYADLGQQAEPARLRFEPPGDGGDDGGGGGIE